MVGDRFVLRDWSGHATLAGGVVLEADARRRGFREDTSQEHLETLATVCEDPAASIPLLLKKQRLAAANDISQGLKISEEDFTQELSKLTSAGTITQLGNNLADANWWQSVLETATKLINEFHRTQPDLAGIPLQDFRQQIDPEIPSEELFQHLMTSLTEELDFQQTGTVVSRAGFTPGLPDDLAAPVRELEAKLSDDPLNPPGRAELEKESASRRALAFLIRTGRAVKLDERAVLLTSAQEDAHAKVLAYLAEHTKATASELRQHLGSSRRIVMPLLEGMDASGLTKREGDYRTAQ